MIKSSDLIKLLKDKSVEFTKEELDKIIETELEKDESERDSELIEVCLNLLNEEKQVPIKKSKKSSYVKIAIFATVAVVLILVNVAAFGKLSRNTPPVSESLVTNKTEATLNTTENKTEKESETATNIAEKTTRVHTTYKLDIKSCIFEPQEIIFFSDEGEQILSKEINRNLVSIINKYLADEYKGSGLKFVAESTMINEIKSQRYIEIYYDSVQTFLAENPSDERTYNHILISLEGQHKNIMFFGTDGKYQSLPIGPLHDDAFTEKFFGVIYD